MPGETVRFLTFSQATALRGQEISGLCRGIRRFRAGSVVTIASIRSIASTGIRTEVLQAFAGHGTGTGTFSAHNCLDTGTCDGRNRRSLLLPKRHSGTAGRRPISCGEREGDGLVTTTKLPSASIPNPLGTSEGCLSMAIDLDFETDLITDRRGTERRANERRAHEGRTKAPAAVKEGEQRVSERRKVERRRLIDPTTCERDYSADEIEFMKAMDEYKRKSGRMFPTWSEVLEVVRSLGYQR
jgi:hypothetical protein